jgi:hypothetical protein
MKYTNGTTIAITTTPIQSLRAGRLHAESNEPEIAKPARNHWELGWLPEIQPTLREERRRKRIQNQQATYGVANNWTLGLYGRITDDH